MTQELEVDIDRVAADEELGEAALERTIHTQSADPEIDALYGKHKNGKLIVQPDFQREFVWDLKKASKLIESALLQIPIPTVYISVENDNREYVIDGQQRLTSFFSFLDGKLPDGRDFKLSGLKVFKELNGKTYAELHDEQQSAIRYYTLRTVTFKKGSDPNLKFEIFERLNTGAVPLNDQELRNCIYRGSYNTLIHELAEDRDFQCLLGLDKPDKRRRDVELVLRFTAFFNQTYLKYKPPMVTFLNEEADRNRNLTADDERKLRAAFKNACQLTRSIFGKNAFKRFHRGTVANPNGHWEPKKFNASLFDVVMFGFADKDKNTVMANSDAIREALINLMTDNPTFIESIELSTSSVQAVQKRFDLWRHELDSLIGGLPKQPRCFTRQLRREMFEKDPTCSLCNQHIGDVDDAALDHIHQYWKGGKTVPHNARLAHRYCNAARPRNS